MSFFEELQLTQIPLNFETSYCSLNARGLKAKACKAFLYVNFQRNYGVLKPNSQCILLSKDINFNRNGVESKMNNSTHDFREMNLSLRLF